MSDNAEFSVWSNDETELLENIENEIKLVSSGSESDLNQATQSNGELWKVLQKNEPERYNGNEHMRQSEVNNIESEEILNHNSNIQLDKLKSHYSSNDLSKLPVEDIPQSEPVPKNVTPFSHSISCNSLSNNEKHLTGLRKYDHVESKIKQYFNVNKSFASCEGGRMVNNKECMEERELNKDDYLEEINRRLTMELEEKNALLTKLQENYENLLLKYAEAQNKIDQLRLKTVCESGECQVHLSSKQSFQRTNLQLPMNIFSSSREHQDSWEDVKCQKAAVVAPFMKDTSYQDKPEVRSQKIDRPSSLPLEPNCKILERDAIKAGTPTDSEGVSSVITSMSGHSKILNTLDVQSPNDKESKLVNYPERDFMLENSVVNDAFDKVKNWQNSLPPLELIETPETTLYDESPMLISPSTNYHLPPSPKNNPIEEDEEVLFPSDRNQNSEPVTFKYKEDDDGSQADFKEYLRTLSLPSALRKKNLTPLKLQKGNSPNLNEKVHSGADNVQTAAPTDDIPSSCIIQKRRKKPPLLRCSSLPAYHCDSPKSANRNVYIPPLDLENLTLSDVDSSQVEYDDKANRATSSSYITSQSGSMDFSSHTYRSINNSFKGRMTDYTDSSYSARQSFNKSTSITPDRCGEMMFPSFARYKNLCQVCGEKVGERDGPQNFPCRSNSYQNFHDVKDSTPKSSAERRGKHPFNRSVSFNSETNRRCVHAKENCSWHRRSPDSLEKFDIYANNLKARSQVIMKALAAHVNNT